MLMATVTRLAGDEEGKGEGGKADDDGDEGGGRRSGNGDKSDGNGNNGGRGAMAMATKRVMVTATRVGEVGGRRNGAMVARAMATAAMRGDTTTSLRD